MFKNDTQLQETLLNSISLIKKSYDEWPNKEIKFIDYVECALGFLTELVTVMIENNKSPYIYQPMNTNIYARFFYDSYEPKIFVSEEDFNNYRLGFKATKELIIIEQNNDKSFTFSISNQILFNYLYASNPCEILNNRIRNIIDKLDNSGSKEFSHQSN